ncbi:hypothetical protein [Streptomyces sp. TRM64462]|uniref:hypothetical protein n=1 Tax=Streptomyces sp. TRM64462 TaxID=2741726 RepID=UPI001586D679|nr:hypothetical protein [Streptomyces sp. TRM64462]
MSITAGMAVLNTETDVSAGAAVLFFALGAAAAFSVLEAVASHGFRKPMDEEPSTVTALGISLSLVSVGTASGLAWVIAHFVGGTVAWPLTGFVVSTVYPLAAGVELAIAQQARESSESETSEEKKQEEKDEKEEKEKGKEEE